jgi:hypothetical protein
VADWVTISSLATAGGTLVLASATYASVRSANRSARLAELTLQEQRRPVLVQSNDDDRAQTIGFVDRYRVNIPGGGAAVEAASDVVYLALSLRNVGAGIAVMQGWVVHSVAGAEPQSEQAWRDSVKDIDAPRVDEFRPLTRDQYIASGDIGIWQGAIRDPADPMHAPLMAGITERRPVSIDLLYTDQVGGQRTISRYGLMPEDDVWRTVAARHWYLDAPSPR